RWQSSHLATAWSKQLMARTRISESDSIYVFLPRASSGGGKRVPGSPEKYHRRFSCQQMASGLRWTTNSEGAVTSAAGGCAASPRGGGRAGTWEPRQVLVSLQRVEIE